MKTLKSVITIGLMFLAINCWASTTNNSQAIEQIRNVTNFDSIDANGAFIINIEANSKIHKVTITADEKILPFIKTDVTGHKLNIFRESESVFDAKSVVINIAIPNLQNLKSSGAVKSTVNNLHANNFNLETSGAARVIISGTSTKFNLDSSGASQIELSGSTNELSIQSAGFSNINTRNLAAEKVSIHTSGASKIAVKANKSLSINSSGMSTISYFGNPQLEQNISGMSKITHLN
jgi:hypothetical protein